ncbi:MAG: hypothetical protein GC159_05900 [Phycisphaera sp.]|nr:hypothetical protein [Phycisphaera sp.]
MYAHKPWTAVLAAGVLTTLITTLTGCGQTYVNIPPLPGDVAGHNVDSHNVANVESMALSHVIQENPPVGQYAVSLPPQTSSLTYNRVLAKLPKGSRRGATADSGVAPETGSQSMPVFRIAQVKIKGLDAEVEVVRPTTDGPRLTSVYLRRDIDDWYVRWSRTWQLPLAEALKMVQPERPIYTGQSDVRPAPSGE